MPPVTTDPEVLPFLVSDMAGLKDGLLALIYDQIAQSDMPVDQIRISLEISPEEDWREVVFEIFVDADEGRATAFWESIGKAIEDWRPTLSRRRQRLLDEDVGVFVEWR